MFTTPSYQTYRQGMLRPVGGELGPTVQFQCFHLLSQYTGKLILITLREEHGDCVYPDTFIGTLGLCLSNAIYSEASIFQ